MHKHEQTRVPNLLQRPLTSTKLRLLQLPCHPPPRHRLHRKQSPNPQLKLQHSAHPPHGLSKLKLSNTTFPVKRELLLTPLNQQLAAKHSQFAECEPDEPCWCLTDRPRSSEPLPFLNPALASIKTRHSQVKFEAFRWNDLEFIVESDST